MFSSPCRLLCTWPSLCGDAAVFDSLVSDSARQGLHLPAQGTQPSCAKHAGPKAPSHLVLNMQGPRHPATLC
jgi:hypothetical protein